MTDTDPELFEGPTVSMSRPDIAADLAPLETAATRRKEQGWSRRQRVGPYRIEGVLGQGGMGIVYNAVHEQLGRRVALKQIISSPGFVERPLLERFVREAESLAALDHKNLVRVYEVGEDEGLPYLAMEYVEGHGLDEILERRVLKLASLIGVVEMAARGVGHAHSRGIVHRDLKPSNIVVETSTGRARVLDFGLAVAPDRNKRLTASQDLLGTPEYMSPEQVNPEGYTEAQRTDPRVDVYALGVILYEILTGATPFAGPATYEVLFSRLTDDPRPPRSIAPGISRDLEAICLRCLEREPADRYADGSDLADDLERYLSGEPIVARRSWIRRARRWIRRHARSLRVAAAAVVVVGAVLTAIGSDLRADRELDRQRRAVVASSTAELARSLDALLLDGQASCEALAIVVETYPDPAARESEIKDLLRRMLERRPRFYGSCVAFEPDAFEPGRTHHMPYYHRVPGGIEFLYPDSANYDYHAMDWYTGPRRTQEVYWTEAYFDANAGNVLMVTCSTPFHGPSGAEQTFRGVTTIDLSLADLHGQMNAIRVGPSGYAFLVESSGRFLSFPDLAAPFPPAASIELQKSFAGVYGSRGGLIDLISRPEGGVEEGDDPFLGRDVYFGVIPLDGPGWRLVTVRPVDEVEAGR